MSVGIDKAGERYCPTCERTFATGDRCPHDGSRLVNLARQSLIGLDLDGRYKIVDKLGEGAMGAVYRATQISVGRDVAIKVVTPTLVSDPKIVKRFLREAKLASRLVHPNAVAVVDFGQTEDGLFYLVMELAAGRTLDKMIEKRGALAPERVVTIGVQVLAALEGAHTLQIVHRDLKPANVMIGDDDQVKVLDFGLAKSLLPDAQQATMTNAGALLGTPAFMPPEVVTGGETDERSDLYSLGCVLYTAATGDPPFVAGSVHELIAMHASEPVPPMVGVPGGLASVILKLLEKDPERRYRNAEKAREALAASLGGDAGPIDPTLVTAEDNRSTVLGWGGGPVQKLVTAPVGAQAASPISQPLSVPRKPRAPVGAIFGVLLLVIAAAAIGYYAMRAQTTESPPAAQEPSPAPSPSPASTPTPPPSPAPEATPTPTPLPSPAPEATPTPSPPPPQATPTFPPPQATPRPALPPKPQPARPEPKPEAPPPKSNPGAF